MIRSNVLPILAAANKPNHRNGYSKPCRQHCMGELFRVKKLPDFQNVFIRKFRLGMTLAVSYLFRMGSSSISFAGRMIAAPLNLFVSVVVSVCSKEQMRRIYAGRNVTMMTDACSVIASPGRNISKVNHPRNPVRSHSLSFNRNYTVSGWICGSVPNPASFFVWNTGNLFPKISNVLWRQIDMVGFFTDSLCSIFSVHSIDFVSGFTAHHTLFNRHNFSTQNK